jgi:DME family drug/metabolite transporter
MSVNARAVLAVLAAAVLFGTSGTALDLGPDAATPLGAGFVRISIGVVVLWLATIASGHGSSVRPAVEVAWPLILVGGVGVAAYTAAFFAAVERTGVAVGTVVAIGSGPFLAGALEWVWRRVRPGAIWLVGTIVTVAGGVVLVVAQADGSTGVDDLGVGFAILAGAGYALYSVSSKDTMSRGVEPTIALAAPFTVGVAIVALFAAREPFGWLGAGTGILMALHLGVAATGAAYLLYGYGLHRLTTATTVTLVIAEPLTATLLAVAVLDETLVPAGWFGVALVVVGLVVVGRSADADVADSPAVAPTPG